MSHPKIKLELTKKLGSMNRIIMSNINTIIEYPIMGIGTGLKDAYIDPSERVMSKLSALFGGENVILK